MRKKVVRVKTAPFVRKALRNLDYQLIEQKPFRRDKELKGIMGKKLIATSYRMPSGEEALYCTNNKVEIYSGEGHKLVDHFMINLEGAATAKAKGLV